MSVCHRLEVCSLTKQNTIKGNRRKFKQGKCPKCPQEKNYRNDPKFSDSQARANSADPDQTAGAVYTVCHSVCIVWTHNSVVKPHISNFRVITTHSWVSEYLRTLR